MKHAAVVLNDLLKISEECIDQSTDAVSSAGELHAKALLATTQKQFKRHGGVLKREIQQIVIKPDEEDLRNGSIYQFWIDLNASITPQESQTVVAAYEYRVDAAQAAYQLAMCDGAIPAYVHRLIQEQHQELQKVHQAVSALLKSDVS